MASESAKKQQYEYRINSNLVLQADRSLMDKRYRDEPRGEVLTLVGRLDNAKMGDKFERSKLELKKDESKEDGMGELDTRVTRMDEDLAGTMGIYYHPKTTGTKKSYEVLLNFIQSTLGDQPRDILRGAADEILAALKDELFSDADKRKEVCSLIGTLSDERYAMLTNLSKKLTDYNLEQDINADDDLIADNYGVTVQFDEEEDDDDHFEMKKPAGELDQYDMREDHHSDEEEDDEQKLPAKDENRKRKTNLADENNIIHGNLEKQSAVDPDYVNPWEIDAYWLQRELNKFYSNAEISHKKAEEVLLALKAARDDRDLENKMILLLGHDKFSLIKVVRKNKHKVLYCTLLAAAQSEKDRAEIERIMRAKPELVEILELLKENEDNNLLKDEREQTSGRRQIASSSCSISEQAGSSKLHVVDLESLAFKEGSHLMTNKKCLLPPGSFRKQKKGFEEVHIPFNKAKLTDKEGLVAISDLPDYCSQAFAGYQTLNRIQSKIYEKALFSFDNLLICAPTGSGKTNVALLCMLREISQYYDNESGMVTSFNFKIIYIAPMKSLVQEMVLNFSKRLKDYGIVVSEMTGDHQLNRKKLESSHVIVCTPEKWDVVSRRAGEKAFIKEVSLVIIDEIHLLHDDRGPILESVVARLHRYSEATQQPIRIVGLSATLPNYKDVATFIRVDNEGTFFFDNSYRPVPLRQEYIGLTEKKALKRFQMSIEIVFDKVMERMGKSQVLIFVHSRKETVKTARAIRDLCIERETLGQFVVDGSASYEVLQSESEQTKNPDLKDLLQFGFAIHHAGMNKVDRTLVEDLFADGHIQLLVSTATLAWGVNLPARTVIIKGTQVYNPEKGKWCELGALDVLQMFGRAGRPQYDTVGEGILITSHSELQYYLSLLNHQLPVESQMIDKLADHLNAEIVSGTVNSLNEASTWLSYTYLYVRMMKNPTAYGVSLAALEEDRLLKQRRLDLAHSAALLLDKHNLIKYDRKSGLLQSTDLGRIASQFYCSYESMSTYNKLLRPILSEIELFRVFSLSNEFKNVVVREEEKVELQQLLERVPIPVKESIEEPSAKVNVLLQSYISQLKLEGFALMSDLAFVTQSAGRLFRALFEICLSKGWAQLADKLLNLCKMVDKRIWLSMSPLRQFTKLPIEVIKRLEKKDFSWERFYDLEPTEIGELIHAPKMGKVLHKYVHHFPKLELSAQVLPISRGVLRAELTITPDFNWDVTIHGEAQPFWVIVEDVDGEKILHHEYFILRQKYAKEEQSVKFFVPIFEPISPHYYIRVVSDQWLHSESYLPISFSNIILPERNPPPTELLDLQPLPVMTLRNSVLEDLIMFPYFNPIQTQVLNSLYNSDESIFIGAPPGSGKTTCCELAIMRFIAQATGDKCVYITPYYEQAEIVYALWKEKFEQKIGVPVVLLTGDATTDVRMLAKGIIVVSTSDFWDSISRRWKQRKHVQAVSLLVVDDAHLIGGQFGPILEVCLSRIRYMASQLEKQIRIVMVSSSVSNCKDLAQWLGISISNTFNFHPNSRPLPMELNIQGFNLCNPSTRHAAMIQSVFKIINQQPYNANINVNDNTIVFVESRNQAISIAYELYLLQKNVAEPRAITEEKFLLLIHELDDKLVKETLEYGVVFLHETMVRKDIVILQQLMEFEVVSTMIVTKQVTWKMNVQAKQIIIMDTQYFDGRSHSYADYAITDILKMMGRAARPLKDDTGTVTIMCQSSKKQFYKRFLTEPLPIESHLDHCLNDHFCTEVVTKTIENKQDAVDYLTWTFMYRRMTQNPNYYGLQGVTHRFLSDHLSELVENTLNALSESKCIYIEDDMDTHPLNLGMIAAYYYINYFSIELFSASLTAGTKQRGLLEIISSAVEYDDIQIRIKEEVMLRKLAPKLPFKISSHTKFNDPHIKVNILLQEYLSRSPINNELFNDTQQIVLKAMKLSQACVDVISSNGWLLPAICAMEFCQMLTQAMWNKDALLLQIPHFDKMLAERCKVKRIENVFDLIDMEDDDRVNLLQLPNDKMLDVAKFCNQYPNIELKFQINQNSKQDSPDVCLPNSPIGLSITMERDEDQTPDVISPYYPFPKQEGWWILLGNPKENILLLIKKVVVQKNVSLDLEFTLATEGKHNLSLYLISDSYLGCDQEFNLQVTCVKQE